MDHILIFAVGFFAGATAPFIAFFTASAIERWRVTKLIASRIRNSAKDMQQYSAVVDKDQMVKIMEILGGGQDKGPLN